jgi:hypothetical protein
MFKAAKAGVQQKAITANRLSDGLVIFLTEDKSWSLAIGDAQLFCDGPDLDAALAFGKAQQDEARFLVDAYAIEVENVGDKPVPSRIRERIRAEGPTVVYGDAERAKLAEAAR